MPPPPPAPPPVQPLQQLPPYAVPPVEFPFRSLVQRAARLALGGEREIALAALTAARFARGSVGPFRLPGSLRQARAAASRVWFSTLTLPARARLSAQRVVDASAGDDMQALAAGLEELIEVAGPVLDRAANAELRALTRLATARADA
ncbi:MAG TPA: hypothetical protein VH762_08185 [Gemmatimonadaceae bacterium]